MRFLMGMIFREVFGSKLSRKMKKQYKAEKKHLGYHVNMLVRFIESVNQFLYKAKKVKKVAPVQKQVNAVVEPANAIHFKTNYNEPMQTI